MPVTRSFLLICLMAMGHAVWAQRAPFSFDFQQVEAAAEAAQENGRPYLVYIYQSDHPTCKRLAKETWTGSIINQLSQSSFLTAGIRLEEVSTQWLTQFHIDQAPCIMIFHPDQHLMGRVDGFIAASTLESIIFKYAKPFDQGHDYPASVLITEPDQHIGWMVEQPAYAMLTRGMESARQSGLSAIEGLEAHFPSQWEDPENSQIGIVYQTYRQRQKMMKDIRQLKKFWRKDIWLYQVIDAETRKPIYRLVLGTFASEEKARFYAKAMRDHYHVSPRLIDLTQLTR